MRTMDLFGNPYLSSDVVEHIRPTSTPGHPVFDYMGMGALAMDPPRKEAYLEMDTVSLPLLIEAFMERDEVSYEQRKELEAICQVAQDNKFITAITCHELENQITWLPSPVGYTGDHHTRMYATLLEEFYENVYCTRLVHVEEWKSLAQAIDDPATDLYPEERQRLQSLIDEHIVAVENAAFRDRKCEHLVKYDTRRLDYVSYDALLRDAEGFYKEGKPLKERVRTYLKYKLSSAHKAAVLTSPQLAHLTRMYQL